MQTNALSAASWLVSTQPGKLPKNWGVSPCFRKTFMLHEGSLQKGSTHANAVYVR